ncbi:DsbA family protein [Lactobacillus hamsteri]|uniref:Dithiol-disulfide isomerase n=1 Tax=Lactobacillus hamsteri DSM 5661 = JCM 6256 TaxID=1423754 RepID=A0A0R1YPJ9_9LACO|nr:DsbA family protein [Lactobacillus hamsteri]KRM41148.1 hypothetical protein FC39_GL001350 [Lactobacillus hamsteri DSM 5661 = JCM 6256]
MFEIFLFINPTGIYCYDTERRIKETIQRLNIDTCYHFVPITSMNIIKDDIIRRHQDEQKTCGLSYYTLTANQALQIYHAIKLAYGNKKARTFLFNLQQKMTTDSSCFSACLVKEIILNLGLNYKDVQSLAESDYVQNSIKQDRKLAEQWKIHKTPTTIIFNEDDDNNYGFLLEGVINQDELTTLLTPASPKIEATENTDISNVFSGNSHLRLI